MDTLNTELTALDFFRAALEPDKWSGLLQRFMSEVGQTAVALSGQSRTDLVGPFFSWGLDEDRIAIFMRDYAHSSQNLAIDVFEKASEGVAKRWVDIVDGPQFATHPIARDLITPMGLEWKFAINLFWDGQYGALCSVLGPLENYPITENALKRATELTKYLAPAFEMTCRLAIAERENQALWDAFSSLGLGLVVQSNRGTINKLNGTAERLLKGGLKEFQTYSSNGFSDKGNAKHAFMFRAEDRQPLIALRLPLGKTSIGQWSDFGANVIVLLEIDREAPFLGQILSNVYGASKRQIEVATRVMDGMTTAEIAENLGVATSTVETHVDRLCLLVDLPNRTALRAWMAQLRSIV